MKDSKKSIIKLQIILDAIENYALQVKKKLS